MEISMLTIEKNCMIIFLTLIISLISMVFIYFVLKWLMGYVKIIVNLITYKFILKLRWKYLLVFCEANMLMNLVGILFIAHKYLGDKLSFLFCFLLLYIWALIISYVRKERGYMYSLIKSTYTSINMDNYFINRIVFIFDQGFSIIIFMLAYEFTILVFTQLEWSMPIHYIALVALSLYLNM